MDFSALTGKIVVVLVVVCQTPVLGKLPDYFPICRRSNPDFNGCIRNATVTMMPYLAKGVSELNIPSMEPLLVPMIKLDQATQAVNFKATLKNLKVHGLSYYSFRKISVDLDSLLFTGSLFLPRVKFEADYTIEGRLLLMPIKGKGFFTANATNAVADFNSKIRRRDVKGVQHLEVSNTMLKLKVGQVKFNLDNLFDGEEIGKSTNNFVRDNSKKIFAEIRPAVESIAAMLVDDISNKMFRSVPENDLFPSN